jgi:hypothetical protein
LAVVDVEHARALDGAQRRIRVVDERQTQFAVTVNRSAESSSEILGCGMNRISGE